jgi:uncharacterized membrane protein
MSDMASLAGWFSAISHRVREREIRRQILSNRVRKAVVSGKYRGSYVADRTSAPLREFLTALAGSLVGFWIITEFFVHTTRTNPLYTLAVFGLIYSSQVTFFKYRLSRDPSYRVPKCRCAGRRNDDTEIVLRSRESAILRIPKSLFGVVFYTLLLVLVYAKHADAALPLAIVAVLVSARLSYVMVMRISSLCGHCINIAALNVLILWLLLY